MRHRRNRPDTQPSDDADDGQANDDEDDPGDYGLQNSSSTENFSLSNPTAQEAQPMKRALRRLMRWHVDSLACFLFVGLALGQSRSVRPSFEAFRLRVA